MITIWHWHTEPFLVGGVLVVVWIYGMLVGPLRHWIDPEALFPRRAAIWFGLGVSSFYLAVGSPLDAAGEVYLFSAHMLQHNVIMYITPIFTILALPGWMVDGVLDRFPRITAGLRWLTQPVPAGFIFTVIFCGWHVPRLYEWALQDKVVHTIEHLTMYGASVLMLWPILSTSRLLPPARWGTHILYIGVLMVAQIPLFGILTFAEYPFYPTYEFAPRLIPGFDPLEDQVAGGLMMKVANMILSLAVMGRAFYLWNREASEREPVQRRTRFAAGRV